MANANYHLITYFLLNVTGTVAGIGLILLTEYLWSELKRKGR